MCPLVVRVTCLAILEILIALFYWYIDCSEQIAVS